MSSTREVHSIPWCSSGQDSALSPLRPRFESQSGKVCLGFPSGSEGKESPCNVGDRGSIPGSGRSPGEGHGNPLVFLPGEAPWTREPGGLQSSGLQSRTRLKRLSTQRIQRDVLQESRTNGQQVNENVLSVIGEKQVRTTVRYHSHLISKR